MMQRNILFRFNPNKNNKLFVISLNKYNFAQKLVRKLILSLQKQFLLFHFYYFIFIFKNMHKNFLLFVICFLFTQNAFSQNPQDREAIKSMCGCYEVSFKFADTFGADTTYKPHHAHHSKGLEWVTLLADEKKKLVLQHLLIADTSIIKHWRQDWIFENQDFFVFEKDNTWKYAKRSASEVKGQWTQKVYQVDDSPRYEGSATWVHVDGKHFWENVTDSPLPRREFTTRTDYNVLKRKNRHEITTYGWLHEQDNDKILRGSEKGDIFVAQEKGWNVYKRVADEKCALAQNWWKKNSPFWAEVRKTWDNVFAQKQTLKFEKAIDKKPMFMHIFALPKESKTPEIIKVIEKFKTK